MIALAVRLWPAAAALALLAAVWFQGHHAGRAACEARHTAALAAAQTATIRAAEEASRREAARLEAEAARDRLARELEDAAHADPVRVPDCLSPDRVRRLNRL